MIVAPIVLKSSERHRRTITVKGKTYSEVFEDEIKKRVTRNGVLYEEDEDIPFWVGVSLFLGFFIIIVPVGVLLLVTFFEVFGTYVFFPYINWIQSIIK